MKQGAVTPRRSHYHQAIPPKVFLPLVFCVLGLLAVSAPAAGAKPAPAGTPLDARTRARLDDALSRAMARTKAPGVIAGVWVGDRGWMAVGGSTRRGATRRPVLGEYTRVGSVTKTFTGTLILQLVDEGKLRLDDTIDRWFPSFPRASDITVSDLGSMSSGIASYTLDPALTGRYLSRPTVAWKPGELIAGAATLAPQFAPGQGFAYSNTNFVMLGQIVEQVTKRPFGDVLRSKILRPLGLRRTSYPSTSKVPDPHWRGYTSQVPEGLPIRIRDATNWSPTFASSAGQMISTLGDLRVWTRALGTGSLLKPATQRARLVPNPASAAGGRAYLFALGIDHGWLAHDGDIPGYNTQIAYLPKLKATIVVMANADIAGSTGSPPAPVMFSALARVISPKNVPTG